jgi:16S rRNA C967 or C1407 C5-methylase (RsmB/RsmF family)/NOL1/NOP2/fmu family ribosome biogenesis protein
LLKTRIDSMFPQGFLQRLKSQSYIDRQALLKSLEEPSPVSIRLNPAKWIKRPMNSEPVPWCGNGYYLGTRPSYTLDPLFHAGCYYPQEASSMFLEHVIKQLTVPLENLRVLDLCGAPGGKSTLLSDLIGFDSLLVTNDVIRARAAVLAETITKWGSGNTLVTQSDPAAFGRLSGFFDIALVDAPCSGEGMFRSEVAVNEWSLENSSHCAERQKRILMDVWPALKENGILIYSTCTFNPGENEENIKWLIAQQEAECVRIDISGFNGITEIDFQGIYGYGLYPNKVRGEGFFISVVRKKSKQEKAIIRSQRKTELRPDKNDYVIADEWTGFSKERLLKWKDELYAVPCAMDDYVHLFQNLNIVKPGTLLYVRKKNDYLPTHELALSQFIREDSFPKMEICLRDALAYLRRDSFALTGASNGWNIVTYNGVNLGFIKNIISRVNNYYPVEWRIRMNISEEGFVNLIKWDSNDLDFS